MRIDYGPGYRVYFASQGEAVVVLLCGGDKQTQNDDIARAKALAKGGTMALETFPWDSAELLESPEDIAAYIEAAFEGGDPSVITHALGVVARAKGMSQVARESCRVKPCIRR